MKRFTATEKWNKPWFRKLPPKLKLFWNWVCDNTDCAGVWVVDLELASIYTGEQYTETEILQAFGHRIHRFANGEKWWLTGFIEFQYGTLSPKCNPHIPVIKALKRHGLPVEPAISSQSSEGLTEGYIKGSEALKEKEQEQDKEKEKEEEGSGEKQPNPPSPSNRSEPNPNLYAQRDPSIPPPTDSEFARGFEIARKLVLHLNAATKSKFSEAGEHMNLIASRVCEVGFDYAGLKRMQDRKVAEWGGTKFAVGLTPRKLYGDDFHTHYGQRETPVYTNGHTPHESLEEQLSTHPGNPNWKRYDARTVTAEQKADYQRRKAELEAMRNGR